MISVANHLLLLSSSASRCRSAAQSATLHAAASTVATCPLGAGTLNLTACPNAALLANWPVRTPRPRTASVAEVANRQLAFPKETTTPLTTSAVEERPRGWPRDVASELIVVMFKVTCIMLSISVTLANTAVPPESRAPFFNDFCG